MNQLLPLIQAPCNDREHYGAAGLRNENLTYEDVLRIVELVKSTQFSEFRLKVGEIEVHLRRNNGAAQQHAAPQPAAIAAEGDPAPRDAERHFPSDVVLVRSPMVGTFYRAPAPAAAPFVKVGQRVEPGTTVCIIEVMKLMNSIAADTRGVVAKILVENGAYVEYAQALMVIRPDPEAG
jgi:acetyl-CoA carboxylase biotin carboxyl carrier protein